MIVFLHYTSQVMALYLFGLFMRIVCTPSCNVTTSSLYLPPASAVGLSAFESSPVMPNCTENSWTKITFNYSINSSLFFAPLKMTIWNINSQKIPTKTHSFNKRKNNLLINLVANFISCNLV